MKDFIFDLSDEILDYKKPLDKQAILDKLSEIGYAPHLNRLKRISQWRNLSDILKIITFAKIISKADEDKFVIGPKAESYKKDSLEEDFFEYLRKFIKKYAFTSVLTDLQLLRLHRLLLRKHAIGGRHGIVPEINKAKVFMESPQVQKKIEMYKKKKKKAKRRVAKVNKRKISLWTLRPEIEPYKWQDRCLKTWFNNSKKGVVEAVTGTGKTILALKIIEELKKIEFELRVAIIVPTKALMYQWYESIINDLQMAENDIGLCGDDHHDDFKSGYKIIIYIYNSAIINNTLENNLKELKNIVSLLIGDEIHRAGSPEFRKIFAAPYTFSLGLSATPDKPTDDNFENVIKPNVGDIIFKYTFKEAKDDEVIPRFEIYNYAINLTEDERKDYDEDTEKIKKIVKKLKFRYYDRLKGVSENLFEAVLRKIQNESERYDPDISNYFVLTSKRKRQLYTVENRRYCLKQILDENKDRKIIMFHERIDVVDYDIYKYLKQPDAVIYHSKFPSMDNKISLELYRRNKANILVSVKALIEGLDVPDTDVGIIVASSSSPTQRIQSMGRILRQTAHKRKTGLPSRLYVIYVKDTTDERIFSRIDWASITDEESLNYFEWTPEVKKPIEPPISYESKFIPCEEIDVSKIDVGNKYPGKFEGTRLSCDHRGKVFIKTATGRSYFDNSRWVEIGKLVMKIKFGGGVFIVNECGHILIKGMKEGKLITIFLGTTDLLKNRGR
ncbi:MAG: DEAD/DEAH box helicase [Candidatus Hodarchaeota archaeon]